METAIAHTQQFDEQVLFEVYDGYDSQTFVTIVLTPQDDSHEEYNGWYNSLTLDEWYDFIEKVEYGIFAHQRAARGD